MRILLIGDASNYHQALAVGLRDLGHEVTVASGGSGWMDTRRDIDLSRRQGKLGGAILMLRLKHMTRRQLAGYDVVQLCSPMFVELMPHRIRSVFSDLRRRNHLVCLTALGFDTPYLQMCMRRQTPIGYNELYIGDRPTPFLERRRPDIEAWFRPFVADHCRYIYDNVDGAITALYEYQLAVEPLLPSGRTAYVGIPVDTTLHKPLIDTPPDTVRFMIACGRGREAEKGVDVLSAIVDDVARKYPGRVDVSWVQNVSHDRFCQLLDSTHLVIDQLYSYTPATTALMAMARGKSVVSGAEPEFYDFIGERSLRPVINADPRDLDPLREQLCRIVDNPALLIERGRQSRQFVLTHNAPAVVAKRAIDFWQSIDKR